MGIGDFIKGKEVKGYRDPLTGKIRPVQFSAIKGVGHGINAINAELSKKTSENIAREQVARQQQNMVTAAQDARRRAQQLIAQRGLSGSSLGLRQELGAQRDMASQSAALQAQLPAIIRERVLQDNNARIAANANAFNQLGGMQTITPTRQGGGRTGGLLGAAAGLAPLAGTVAGFAMGGPAGAAIGSQVGQGTSTALNRTQNPNQNQMYA